MFLYQPTLAVRHRAVLTVNVVIRITMQFVLVYQVTWVHRHRVVRSVQSAPNVIPIKHVLTRNVSTHVSELVVPGLDVK